MGKVGLLSLSVVTALIMYLFKSESHENLDCSIEFHLTR